MLNAVSSCQSGQIIVEKFPERPQSGLIVERFIVKTTVVAMADDSTCKDRSTSSLGLIRLESLPLSALADSFPSCSPIVSRELPVV